MRITDLKVDGFGAWTDVRLDDFADGLNVVFGPNESGKSTLMQFIRSVLYGLGEERRRRFLPPAYGGPGGGTVTVKGPQGARRVTRRDDGSTDGALSLADADGAPQPSEQLQQLLGDVDESIYRNVFAVGLREMQELNTLDDEQVAERLYNLAGGVDRVSLPRVLARLERWRLQLLRPDGGPSRVTELLARREVLRGELAGLRAAGRRYTHLAAERRQINRDVESLEAETKTLELELRTVQAAVALGQKWQERDALAAQLEGLARRPRLPADAVQRFEHYGARIRKRRRRYRQLKKRRARLREQAAALGVNEPFTRQAAHVAALCDQRQWIAALERRAEQLRGEVAGIRQQLGADAAPLGISGDFSAHWTSRGSGGLQRLRPLAKKVAACQRAADEAARAAADAEAAAAATERQVQAALSSLNERNLNEALEAAERKVKRLQQRVDLQEHIERMEGQLSDLRQRDVDALDEQLLPVRALVGLGALFVLGVVLILSGLVLSSGTTVGWAMAFLGLAGMGAAVGLKFLRERSHRRSAEQCQRQIAALGEQLKEARAEREELDRQLPRGGGPLTVRLQAARDRLAGLESAQAADAQRRADEQSVLDAQLRAEEAENELKAARAAWRQGLRESGLPEGLAPNQVRNLSQQRAHLQQLRERLDVRQHELQEAARSQENFVARIRKLCEELEIAAPPDAPATALLDRLAVQLREQESLRRQRDALRRESLQLRRRGRVLYHQARRFARRRRSLLRRAEAVDADDLRRRVEEQARQAQLQGQAAAVEAEIAACLTGGVTEAGVRGLLSGPDAARLPQQAEELAARQSRLEDELLNCYENRGRLEAQLHALAEDRRWSERRLQLAAVEEQLRVALQRWRVLAVTTCVLEQIREMYETQRQPETLREASRYLKILTEGRYTRVWTPLAEQTLRVTSAQGDDLPVEVLSRGTREQLFLSLRLALVASYARRGVRLPLVLDDVLVNFDAPRAAAATRLLRDFARDGHQLLVFTCHEHIAEMFRALRVDVRRLDEPAAQNRQRRRARRRRAVIVEPEPPTVIEVQEAAVDRKTRIDKPHPEPDGPATTAPEPAENDEWSEADESHVVIAPQAAYGTVVRVDNGLPWSPDAEALEIVAPRDVDEPDEVDEADEPPQPSFSAAEFGAEEFPGELEDDVFRDDVIRDDAEAFEQDDRLAAVAQTFESEHAVNAREFATDGEDYDAEEVEDDIAGHEDDEYLDDEAYEEDEYEEDEYEEDEYEEDEYEEDEPEEEDDEAYDEDEDDEEDYEDDEEEYEEYDDEEASYDEADEKPHRHEDDAEAA